MCGLAGETIKDQLETACKAGAKGCRQEVCLGHQQGCASS